MRADGLPESVLEDTEVLEILRAYYGGTKEFQRKIWEMARLAREGKRPARS